MKTRLARVLTLLVALVMVLSVAVFQASAVAVTGVSGVEVTVNKGSISESGGTVTVTTEKGSLLSDQTVTVTMSNTTGSTVTISFDYSVKNATSCSLGSTSGGVHSVLLQGNSSTTFTVKPKNWSTATLTLSNFMIEVAAAESNVTVSYGSLGSVKIDGTAVASGSVNPVSSASGASFVAVPGSGSKFVAWINPTTNAVISTSATYQLIPTEDMSIRAVFAKASAAPVFFADGTAKVFESLDAALSYASSASNKVITLAGDATLAAGNYTIPAGVTMNIPYDAAGTLYTTKPGVLENAYTAPSVFRTLNMAEGANLTVNGTLSLSAQLSSKYGHNGAPSGPLPFIKMAKNSKITVENGAAMYVYGFITGSGSVEVKSGATVYECFQIADYRGGDATSAIVGKDDEYGVFPFNQYYIQNVEVPLTIHAGATEVGYTALYVTLAGVQESDVPFIGSNNSMFVLNSGYIVKDYLEGTGRLDVKLYGDVAVSTMSMSMKVSLIGSLTIDSSKYALPIAQHLTLSVESGNITMGQSVAFLPGSELYIRQGATCTLGASQKIIIYDLDQWLYNDGANGYSGTTNLPYMQAKYVPGGDGTEGRLKDALIQVDGTINATDGAVYATSGGANVYSTGTGKITLTPGTETVTYQVITNDTNVDSWPEIAIESVVLQNADGTKCETAKSGVTWHYKYNNGQWICDTEVEGIAHTFNEDEGVVTAPTCTEDGYTTYTCTICGYKHSEKSEAATGHTVVTDAGYAPTCTETGLTEGSHCSVCGEVTVKQEVVAAPGHKYESVVTAPTCTAEGFTTYTCSVCDDSYVDNKVAALGHTEVIDAAVAATCTESGLTEGKHCSVCGEVTVAQEVVAALGHTEVIDAAKAPTCTETGLTEGSHCSVCKAVLTEQEEIAALGHTEVIDAAVAANCTETGLTEGKHCSVCGEVTVAQEVVAALGHTEVIDAAKAPTCTETGLTEGKHCSVCGEVTVAQEEVSALGHSYGDWVVTKPANYTTAGEKAQSCGVCGNTVTEEIPVLDNPVDTWNITLGDNIGVNFVTTLTAEDTVVVTVNGEEVAYTVSEGKISVNVAAAQMKDIIAVSVNGMPLANTYSVRGYADTILADASMSKYHELVKNMLVYGGAAQNYFGYNSENAEDLASNGIDVTAAAPTGDTDVEVSGSVSGLSFYGATLVHETKTAVRIYFTGSVEDITFTVNGKAVDVQSNKDMYYIEVAGINPQNLATAVTVVASDGAASLSVSYSPLNYMVRMYNKAETSDAAKALVQALYGYYLAAAALTA